MPRSSLRRLEVNEDDRKLIAETVSVMNGLRSDMQEFRCETKWFRDEMREFKQNTLLRITALESDQVECQKNPTVCATARLVEGHLSGHKGGKSFAVSIWAVCVSTAMCVFTIVMELTKRS
jgi:hypothetical protein